MCPSTLVYRFIMLLGEQCLDVSYYLEIILNSIQARINRNKNISLQLSEWQMHLSTFIKKVEVKK